MKHLLLSTLCFLAPLCGGAEDMVSGVFSGTLNTPYEDSAEIPTESMQAAVGIELPESSGLLWYEPSWFMHPDRKSVVLLSEPACAGWIIRLTDNSSTKLKTHRIAPFPGSSLSRENMGDIGHSSIFVSFSEKGFWLCDDDCTPPEFLEEFDMNGTLLRDEGNGSPQLRLADNNYAYDGLSLPFLQDETGLYRKDENGKKTGPSLYTPSFSEDTQVVDIQAAELKSPNDGRPLYFYFWRARHQMYRWGCNIPYRQLNNHRDLTAFAFISAEGEVLSQGKTNTSQWDPAAGNDPRSWYHDEFEESKPQRIGDNAVALTVRRLHGDYVYLIVSADDAGQNTARIIRSDALLYFSPLLCADGSILAVSRSEWLGYRKPISRSDEPGDLNDTIIYSPSKVYIIPHPIGK